MTFLVGAAMWRAGARFGRWDGYARCGAGGFGAGCGRRGDRGHHSGEGWAGEREDEGDRGSRGSWEPGRRGPGARFFLRFLFERLDTTPGQEKVLAKAFDEIRESFASARGEFVKSRSRVADAIRGAEFDHEAVGDTWVKHDGLFEDVRLKIVTAMQQVHEALDERQRKILADLIERGGPFARFGGFRGRG